MRFFRDFVFLIVMTVVTSRDGSVSKVMGCRLGNWDLIPSRNIYICLCHYIQTGSGAAPCLLTNGYWKNFSWE
jgi:hypothetical protein